MATASPAVPLNVFQSLMRRWDAVHPYNAAQAVHLAGTPDVARLEAAWQSALLDCGLGSVAVHRDRYGFAELNGHAAAYAVRACGGTLSEHLSAELNRPFDDPHEPPFRPFVVGDGTDGYYVGLVYQHWLADSQAVRLLVREWFVRAFDPPAACRRRLHLPTGGYARSLLGGRDGFDVAAGLLGLARRHCRMRRVQKVASTNLSDPITRFALFPAEDGLITRVRAAATARGAKVTDLLLAALAEACAAHVPLQRRPRRTDVAVASVVDLRPRSRADLSRTFGLFLGFTHVAARPADLRRFDDLVAVVARQTRQQKAMGVAASSLTWISTALALGRLGRPEELYHFYRKELPLAGAISNVDLTGSWVARYAPGLVRGYVRASPTGPMAPLVVSTTTLGERFQLGLTYRTGLIDDARAGTIAASVLGRLRAL